MARGASSKSEIYSKLIEVFPDSFLYNGDKELRIPYVEDGEHIEIKCVLTCAKVPVGNAAAPLVSRNSSIESSTATNTGGTVTKPAATSDLVAPTQQEKETVNELLSRLGLQ